MDSQSYEHAFRFIQEGGKVYNDMPGITDITLNPEIWRYNAIYVICPTINAMTSFKHFAELQGFGHEIKDMNSPGFYEHEYRYDYNGYIHMEKEG